MLCLGKPLLLWSDIKDRVWGVYAADRKGILFNSSRLKRRKRKDHAVNCVQRFASIPIDPSRSSSTSLKIPITKYIDVIDNQLETRHTYNVQISNMPSING